MMHEREAKTPVTHRRPGRPRSDRARRAILDATLQLLVEQGFDGMTIEGVAARAGVGKATIYRRWSSKRELVAMTLASIDDDVRAPDTGNTRDDLIALVRDFARVSTSTVLGPMISRVAGAAVGDPELMEIVWNNLIAKRQEIGRQVLRRGIDRGDVRPEVDVDLVMDMVAGTAIFTVLFNRLDVTNLADRLEPLVDTIWSGIRASKP
jgi:AcrR family transcriptional regulator